MTLPCSIRRALALLLCLGGCARPPEPGAVTPAEIPDLIARAERAPSDAAVRFRLAAALLAAQRCDTAPVVARAALVLGPDNVLGPLVLGGCEEQAGRYDRAVAVYTEFAAAHARARGVAALHARGQLALRAGAEQTARQALEHERELAGQPAPPATVAVLPLVIAGDSSYEPLSRGLADLITTDLAYVRTLRLLERLQIGVLVDELKLDASERVDPATAARVGRLLRAARMVQGTASIPGQGPVELSASVVTETGVVRPVGQVQGPFPRLLELEKRVVFDLVAELGIQLTEAERQEILRQGPKNLAAFLAYSRALEAMDRGDFEVARRAFGAAAQADPSFGAARQGQGAAAAAPLVQQTSGGGLVTVVQAVEQVAPASEPMGAAAPGGVLATTKLDLVPTRGDVLGLVGPTSGVPTLERQLTAEVLGVPSIISVANGITIIFIRPP